MVGNKYNLPRDVPEDERLKLQHKLFFETLNGKLYLAPLPPDITDALDVGSGTGDWAIDFAKSHHSCKVIGTDLTPIKAPEAPSNCSFLVHDADSATQEWHFPAMDFIHSRFLVMGLRDWPGYMKRAFSTLKPGGWIEIMETEFPGHCDDGTAGPDDPFLHWSGLVAEGARKVGIDPQCQRGFEKQLGEAGFINIQKREFRWPEGSWSDDEHENKISKMLVQNQAAFVESAAPLLIGVLKMPKEEVDAMFDPVMESSVDVNKHQYALLSVHWAQKPE